MEFADKTLKKLSCRSLKLECSKSFGTLPSGKVMVTIPHMANTPIPTRLQYALSQMNVQLLKLFEIEFVKVKQKKL